MDKAEDWGGVYKEGGESLDEIVCRDSRKI